MCNQTFCTFAAPFCGILFDYYTVYFSITIYTYYKKNGILYQNFGEKKVITNIPPLTKVYVDKNGIENYWDPLTEAQIESTVNIVKLLMREYSIPPNMILTHEEIQSKTAGEGQAVKDAIFDYLI